jgi:hypothetical protein
MTTTNPVVRGSAISPNRILMVKYAVPLALHPYSQHPFDRKLGTHIMRWKRNISRTHIMNLQ